MALFDMSDFDLAMKILCYPSRLFFFREVQNNADLSDITD